jgi:hypothetical protein
MEVATEIVVEDLKRRYPPTSHPTQDGRPCIPGKYVPQIADELTSIIANVVASYLDAGSERDAVQESLGPVIEAELHSWSELVD